MFDMDYMIGAHKTATFFENTSNTAVAVNHRHDDKRTSARFSGI